MSELPKGWIEIDFEDSLASLEDGRTIHQGWSPRCEKEPSNSDDVWGVLKTTAIQSGAFLPEHNKRLPEKLTPRPLLEVRRGDVLITCAGPRARCGVACLVRGSRPRLMLSGKMYRLRFDDRFVDPRYVEAYLLSDTAVRAIDRMKTGGSDSGLNLTHGRFRRLQFPLAPRAEQERIVAAIEEQLSRLDAADASLSQARRRLDAFRRAALVDGFNGSWPRVPLKEVTDEGRPICYGILKPKTVGDLRVPYVEVRSIKNGRVDVESLHRTTRALHDKFKRSELRAGDVVLAIRGSFDRAAVVPVQLEGANVSRDVARIAPLPVLDSSYLAHYLGGPVAYRYFAGAARGVAVRGVNIGDLRTMPIPLPPLEEQKRIVAEVEERLSVIDAMRASIERAERRSAALRRSILERAFRGELVPQDPSDEPASVLLDRIRAARGADVGLKKARARR